MRSILIDWLIEVHLKFHLQPETLFTAICILDRISERTQISRQKFQLVGVTALVIACKLAEIHMPEMSNFIYITDNSYSV
jgi:hypothetical protein